MDSTEKTIVVFGAGKIGRSFVGQLFSRAGYHVTFVDVNQRVIGELNKRRKYQVVIKSGKDEIIEISNVSGILSTDLEAVAEAVAGCGLMATCVGKDALLKILPLIAKGVEKRFLQDAGNPLDIILAENVRGACTLVRNGLVGLLKEDFPVDSYIGLIETSIGKMVPIMPGEIENEDPLLVFGEPYNTLIVGKDGFKNSIPAVPGLEPKENIKAWVDRKAFIHNLGHATAAYFGYYKHPEQKYLYEVLKDQEVFLFTKETMLQSANVLRAVYPDDFSMTDLELYIEDLLSRFQNKALKDTVFRIGQDRLRKLGPDDRFVGIISMAENEELPHDRILEAMAYAFFFHATDENGNPSPQDILFDNYHANGVEYVLSEVCGFNGKRNNKMIADFIQLYNKKCFRDKN